MVAIKVLVVESDADERQRILNELQTVGCDAVLVGNADDALASFVAENPDLVVCTAQLPDIGGANLAHIILSKAPDTLVVLIVDRPDEAEGSDLPALRRPLDLQELHTLFPALVPSPLGEQKSPAREARRRLTLGVTRLQASALSVLFEYRLVVGIVAGCLVGILSALFLIPRSEPHDPGQIVLSGSEQPLHRKAMRAQLFASYRKKDYVEAVAAGELLRESTELDWQAAYTLAQAKQKAGLSDQAIADYRAFAEHFPENKKVDAAMFKAAELLRAQGKNDEARALYRQVANGLKGDLRKSARTRLTEMDERQD